MMTLNHSSTRQVTHLSDMPSDEIEGCLDAVATAFGLPWLQSTGKNPFQVLWQRKDFAATNQLLLLGDAINRIGIANPKHLKSWVNDIKTGDDNTRKGSIFELLGMNLFASPSLRVTPTPLGFRGYDATLGFPEDGGEILLSIKNYGESRHEAIFKERCSEVNGQFKNAILDNPAGPLTMRALCTKHPEPSDWRDLKAELCHAVASDKAGSGALQKVGNWLLSFHQPPALYQPYSQRYLSYQTSILAPFHVNESKNLLDKLDEAAANARKHAAVRFGNIARAVLVRLPETMPFQTCAAWADQYIAQNSHGPIDAIFLYQPSIIDKGKESVFHHGFASITVPNFSLWMESRKITIRFLIGIFDGGKSHVQLVDGDQIGDISHMYVYQAGDFYTVVEFNPAGVTQGELNSLASGNFRHTVLRSEGMEGLLLSGIFPPSKSLSLFA